MKEVFRSPFFTIAKDDALGVVRFARSAASFATVGELEGRFAEAIAVLDTFDRARFRLLIDMRDGPMRNDPEFDAALGRAREGVIRGYDRVAVLVRTATGSLQVNRHIREDKLDSRVFFDEREAIAHLRPRPGSSQE